MPGERVARLIGRSSQCVWWSSDIVLVVMITFSKTVHEYSLHLGYHE